MVRSLRPNPHGKRGVSLGMTHRIATFSTSLIAASLLSGCTVDSAEVTADVEPSASTQAATAGPSQSPQPRAFADLEPGWTNLPLPPEVRSTSAATAWTGDELIVWGGYVYTGYSDEVPRADGFRFDARAREWRSIAPSPLGPRTLPAAAWTGDEMLIWGGSDRSLASFFDDGAAYDPATDTWHRLPPAPITPRAPLSVWTGEEFLLWGSKAGTIDDPAAGAAYNPLEHRWRRIADAPLKLTRASAAWTGEEMIAFGDGPRWSSHQEVAVGIAYEPKSDSWRRLPASPLTEEATTIAWSGRELIAWDYANDTAAYDPTADNWRRLGNTPLDNYECSPQSVWIDGYFFGDYCGAMVIFDRRDEAWHDISRRELRGWGFTIVAADPVVLLMGRNVDTKEEAMFAYRPPPR